MKTLSKSLQGCSCPTEEQCQSGACGFRALSEYMLAETVTVLNVAISSERGIANAHIATTRGKQLLGSAVGLQMKYHNPVIGYNDYS